MNEWIILWIIHEWGNHGWMNYLMNNEWMNESGMKNKWMHYLMNNEWIMNELLIYLFIIFTQLLCKMKEKYIYILLAKIFLVSIKIKWAVFYYVLVSI